MLRSVQNTSADATGRSNLRVQVLSLPDKLLTNRLVAQTAAQPGTVQQPLEAVRLPTANGTPKLARALLHTAQLLITACHTPAACDHPARTPYTTQVCSCALCACPLRHCTQTSALHGYCACRSADRVAGPFGTRCHQHKLCVHAPPARHGADDIPGHTQVSLC